MSRTEQTIDPLRTRLLREFSHEIPLMCCVIDPTGRWCIAGGRGRKIYMTHLNTGTSLTCDDHESWVVTCARWSTPGVPVDLLAPHLTPPPPPLPAYRPEQDTGPSKPNIGQGGTGGTQSLVITGDLVGRLIRWDTLAERPELSWSIETGHGTLRTVSISRDGRLVATAGGDGAVRLWSASDGSPVRELLGHKCPVFSSAFHPAGQHLLTGDRGEQKIKQWDIDSGMELREFDAQDLSNYKGGTGINYGGVRDLAFNADGSVIFCCGRDSYAKPGLLLQFDWTTGEQICKQVSAFASSIFHHVIFHPQGFLLTAGVGAQTGEIWFWKPDQEDKLGSLKVAGPAYGMDLHPDGRHIAVAQMSGPRTYGDRGILGLFEMPTSESKLPLNAKVVPARE